MIRIILILLLFTSCNVKKDVKFNSEGKIIHKIKIINEGKQNKKQKSYSTTYEYDSLDINLIRIQKSLRFVKHGHFIFSKVIDKKFNANGKKYNKEVKKTKSDSYKKIFW